MRRESERVKERKKKRKHEEKKWEVGGMLNEGERIKMGRLN